MTSVQENTKQTRQRKKEKRQPMETTQEQFAKCKKCKQSGYLIMHITVCDEICEGCGTWQNGIYNDMYVRVG